MAAGRSRRGDIGAAEETDIADAHLGGLIHGVFDFVDGAPSRGFVGAVQIEFLREQPGLAAVLDFDAGAGQQRLHFRAHRRIFDPGYLDHFEKVVRQNLVAGLENRTFTLHRGRKRHEMDYARTDDVVEWDIHKMSFAS